MFERRESNDTFLQLRESRRNLRFLGMLEIINDLIFK